MPDLIRSNPFDFPSMPRALERLFDDPFFRRPSEWFDGALAVDVSEQDGKVVVQASVPGFTKEEIEVQINEGVLSIKAHHLEEKETKEEKYYLKERREGSLSRRVSLPGIVQDAPVDAELKDGVLTVRVAIPEKAQPKAIEIKAG
jgi:HSP20 family protein